MQVKCKAINIDELNVIDTVRDYLRKGLPDGKARILRNSVYVVYAMVIRNNDILYYIADDDYTYYPFAYSSHFFDVYDNRISKYWRIRPTIAGTLGTSIEYSQVLLAPVEMIQDDSFYDRLLDSDDAIISQFKLIKSLMDVEYPHPSVKVFATIIDDGSLLCPICSNAWENNSKDGILSCSACNSQLNNPCYVVNRSENAGGPD